MNFKHEALAKQAWSGIQKSQKNLVATATFRATINKFRMHCKS